MNTTAETLIELHDVSLSYDSGQHNVINHVSLSIHQGERIALVGPNGSGKSTLSRIIAGLMAPDQGTVRLMGRTVFDEQGAHAHQYRAARRAIGAVFQNPEDQIVTTVTQDDVAFGPENLGVARDHIAQRITHALADVQMSYARQADPTTLSGGEQQRVAIAGMLAMHSQVLILDEPTAMLDPHARNEVLQTLDRIEQQGVTIVMVTHRQEEIALASRVIALQDGSIVDYIPKKQQEVQLPRRKQSSCNNDAIISCEHVSYTYPDAQTRALDDVNVRINQGCIVALMGPNGSGKSTFVRALAALITPDEGSIRVSQVEVTAHARRAKRVQRTKLRHILGYVMQHPERQLFADSVLEDVSFGPRNLGYSEQAIADQVKQALAMLHIEHLQDRAPLTLSGGQQRLVAIAGVLACNPDVIIMDEPTAGLDFNARERIYQLMCQLRDQGKTILFITHEPDAARLLADTTLCFDQARDDVPHPHVLNVRTRKQEEHSAQESSQNESYSVLALLDPRVKIIGFLILMCSAFMMNSFAQLALGIFTTGILFACSHISLRQLWRSTHMFLAVFICVAILNMIVVRSGTPLIHIAQFSLTDHGVYVALLYMLRFSIVIVLGALVLLTTTPTQLTDAFESMLSPLKRWHIHIQELALVLSLAMRFLPLLLQESQAIHDAQASRGGSIDSGKPLARIRAMCALIVPVIAGAIRHADTLALALDARCYEEGITRTHWRVLAFHARDAVFLIGVGLFIVGLVLLRSYGVLLTTM